jgi:NosR/NirI family nitrous oxide reductase transcriptional regulator
MGQSESAAPVVDLFFGVVDAPQIGRALLGDPSYEHPMAKLAEGEQLLAIFNRGESSFKGSACWSTATQESPMRRCRPSR